jgi:hypothetical protein
MCAHGRLPTLRGAPELPSVRVGHGGHPLGLIRTTGPAFSGCLWSAGLDAVQIDKIFWEAKQAA